jgi:hypothetical protein
MKNFIRISPAAVASVVAAFSLLSSGLAFSQSANITNFKKSYESSCVKEQVKRHAGVKGITADQFAAHCECTSAQLSKSLNTNEIETLLSKQTRPSWFKEKESAAAKSCLMQEPKIQVRILDLRLNQGLG